MCSLPCQAFKGVALGATPGGIQETGHVDGVSTKAARHNAVVCQNMPVKAVVVPDLAYAGVLEEDAKLFHDRSTLTLHQQLLSCQLFATVAFCVLLHWFGFCKQTKQENQLGSNVTPSAHKLALPDGSSVKYQRAALCYDVEHVKRCLC